MSCQPYSLIYKIPKPLNNSIDISFWNDFNNLNSYSVRTNIEAVPSSRKLQSSFVAFLPFSRRHKGGVSLRRRAQRRRRWRWCRCSRGQKDPTFSTISYAMSSGQCDWPRHWLPQLTPYGVHSFLYGRCFYRSVLFSDVIFQFAEWTCQKLKVTISIVKRTQKCHHSCGVKGPGPKGYNFYELTRGQFHDEIWRRASWWNRL